MSIDLSQFIPTFLEESFEGLEVMENGLLNLDSEDDEMINAIFRAAHSIKGGSGTFGFNQITHFTHVVETLLDEVRSGKRAFSETLKNVLLESVDCIRMLLEAARDGAACENPKIERIHQKLTGLLTGEVEALGDVATDSETESRTERENNTAPEAQGWRIRFEPESQLLMTGNEPMLLFAGLEDLGTIAIEVDTDQLPDWDALNPEFLYLSWTITLVSDCSEADIHEVFEWVEDDCRLIITTIAHPINVSVEDEPRDTDASVVDHPESGRVATASDTESPASSGSVDSVSASITPSNQPATASKSKAPIKSSGSSARKAPAEAGSIRVGIDKVDGLINRVGELVITQSMLGQVGHDLSDLEHPSVERLHEGLAQLERNARDLQEEVMRIRMLPISFVFNRFPRMVHDVSSQLGKKVELKVSGEHTELDKTVMEKIGDPLVHLLRNSLDHGLETPKERSEAGKAETGIVTLNAYHQGGYIIIEIKDDGRGLNTQRIYEKAIEKGLISSEMALSEKSINELIFRPGFSTADAVSDLSGRGVGMDVVRRNIESLGGNVSVKSEAGRGSTFTVSLPLTLAILDGQLVQVNNDVYIVPLVSIVESIQISKSTLKAVAGEGRLFHFRDEYIPIFYLRRLFNLSAADNPLSDSLMVVVEASGQKVGLVVDDLQGQQQVVIKSLETNYKRIQGLSGATILGNGDVALILDVSGLLKTGQDPLIQGHTHDMNANTMQDEVA